MSAPRVHYAGGIRTKRTEMLMGWPCCCSGERAVRIRAEGNQTLVGENVTCAACKRVMARAIGRPMHVWKDGRCLRCDAGAGAPFLDQCGWPP